ncbi:hypothetical protein BK133_13960 [Paenibacillus sp. FSL H8-0548]|nr:hypothetical protein BK133_13960 [Paenibacillus sp. FSL H8-0548]
MNGKIEQSSLYVIAYLSFEALYHSTKFLIPSSISQEGLYPNTSFALLTFANVLFTSPSCRDILLISAFFPNVSSIASTILFKLIVLYKL